MLFAITLPLRDFVGLSGRLLGYLYTMVLLRVGNRRVQHAGWIDVGDNAINHKRVKRFNNSSVGTSATNCSQVPVNRAAKITSSVGASATNCSWVPVGRADKVQPSVNGCPRADAGGLPPPPVPR